jgi:hypothetical protein
MAMVVAETQSHQRTDRTAIGAVFWAGYHLVDPGFTAGLRYAYEDPDNKTKGQNFYEYDAMVGYKLYHYPVRVLLQGTILEESRGRQVNNNSINALGQYTF